MATTSERMTWRCRRDHEWLLERLHSLDNCVDNLYYYGEVCSDLRGFGGLRQRCQEIIDTLRQHMPEEEQVFAGLENRRELRPLLDRLVEEHRIIARDLEGIMTILESLVNGEMLPEDLFTLQDRVRALSSTLQDHIATEDRLVMPLLAAA